MNRGKKVIITLCFAVSGSVGLIYEVLWQRNLALIFGTTLPALTAVLAAFMGGLALGSLILGWWVDRIKNPLRLYAFLEIGIGVYCFFIPGLFRMVNDIHVRSFQMYGPSGYIEFLRFVYTLMILLVPCLLMGGTLPVLSKGIIQGKDKMGSGIAFLYFLNTLGAMFGTLLAGFWAIPVLGCRNTNFFAVALNLAIGTTFLLISSENASMLSRHAGHKTPEKAKQNWILYAYGILGFCAIGCEVVWTRALILVIGSTVYAFSMMLAAFLMGVAIGSYFSGKYVDALVHPLKGVGFTVIATGFFVAVSIGVIICLPVVLVELFPLFHSYFFLWQACLFLMGLVVIFPATFCMGAVFPMISKAYIHRMKRLGQGIGNLYLWNTLGGIIGSCITGFVLIPFLGTRQSLMGFALTFLMIGLMFILHRDSGYSKKGQSVLITFLGVFLVFVQPHWDSSFLDSGAYVYAPQLLNGFEKDRKVLFEKEGVHSYVTVTEKAGIRSLRINGKTDGSDGGDLVTQILLGQLPLLFAERPRQIAVIGLGTGVTVGSVLTHPEVSVDCIEIDKAVIEASRYFDHVSNAPMDSERCHIIAADARTVLNSENKKYDVIISEPSNPWITGVSNLFTWEHFNACRNKMTSDGIMCQWIHTYYMDPQIMKILLKTFSEVFPCCSLWNGSRGDFLILGTSTPQVWNDERTRMLFSETSILNDYRKIDIHVPAQVKSRQLLNPEKFKRMVEHFNVPLNTDDKPLIEFLAPQSLYHNTVQENLKMIGEYI